MLYIVGLLGARREERQRETRRSIWSSAEVNCIVKANGWTVTAISRLGAISNYRCAASINVTSHIHRTGSMRHADVRLVYRLTQQTAGVNTVKNGEARWVED